MTVENLIEILKEFKPHWIILPEVEPNYEGNSEVSLYPKKDADNEVYDVDGIS